MSELGLKYSTYTDAFGSNNNQNTSDVPVKKGSAWDSLFSNFGGILVGAGSLVTAFKTDPNKVAEYESRQPFFFSGGDPNTGARPNNNSWLWIIAAILGLVLIVFVIVKVAK